MDERWLVDFFKDLHAHPDLSHEEHRTTARVLEALRAHDIEVLETGLDTGVVAVVGSGRVGRTIGLRCDMDALPIREETGLAYASTEPGKMHACGHDFHTAVMLGTAIRLKACEAQIEGRVKVVFQPAEETADGARSVIATGALDDVAEFYGVHSYPWLEPGVLGIKEGPVMAAPDRFAIDIRGRGVHAAQPDKGIDPIPAAAATVLAAQGVVGRSVSPFSAAVVSVAHVEAGNTWNVLPDHALLEGTVRTLDVRDKARIRRALECLASSTAEAYGCTAQFDWHQGPPAVINDSELCDAARRLALEMGFEVRRQEDTMDGEDFSEYLQRCPGMFIRVGTGGGCPSHHARFAVDPSAIWPASEFFARLALARAGVPGSRGAPAAGDVP